MGLDFMLYKRKIDTREDEEIAYGRKSWELVYVLCPDQEEWDDLPKITLELWDNLMIKLNKIGPKLEAISEAYDILNNLPDDFPEMVFTDEHKKLIAEYELWYNREFSTPPTLGYDFSVGYMMSFFDADKVVREAIEDPEYEVVACVSY